jgi:hypothetical protein
MSTDQASDYAATAYRSDRIPKQQPSTERSWIRRFAKMRLPWEMMQEVAPEDFPDPAQAQHVEISRENEQGARRKEDLRQPNRQFFRFDVAVM